MYEYNADGKYDIYFNLKDNHKSTGFYSVINVFHFSITNILNK